MSRFLMPRVSLILLVLQNVPGLAEAARSLKYWVLEGS